MKRMVLRVVCFAGLAAALGLLAGCSTLDVPIPGSMFLSNGDYVPGVRTMGIIQEKTSVFAPLFIVDTNKVNQTLYQKLIAKAQAVGADGVTNVHFTWAPSPLMGLTVFIASGWFDYYIEGVAIKKQ
jgi:hypothetical protein